MLNILIFIISAIIAGLLYFCAICAMTIVHIKRYQESIVDMLDAVVYGAVYLENCLSIRAHNEPLTDHAQEIIADEYCDLITAKKASALSLFCNPMEFTGLGWRFTVPADEWFIGCMEETKCLDEINSKVGSKLEEMRKEYPDKFENVDDKAYKLSIFPGEIDFAE